MTDNIGVKINDDFVEVFPNTSISIRLASPLFTTDNIIPGEFSFPFEVPGGDLSPRNAKTFNNPDVVENIEAFRRIEASLYYMGVPFKKGKLSITAINGRDKYSMNYIFGMSTLSDEFKTKKLPDLVGNPQINIWYDELTKMIYVKPAPGAPTPYKLMVNGQRMEANTLDGLRAQINISFSDQLKVLSAYVAAGPNTPLGVAPPYLRIFPHDPANIFADYTHTESFPLWVAPVEDTDEEKANWYVEAYDQTDYHDRVKDSLADFLTAGPFNPAVRFPFCWNEKTYDNEQDAIQPNYCVNGQAGGDIVTNDANWGVTNSKPFEISNQNTIQPFMRVKYILDRMAEYFNFEWEGDFYTDEKTGRMLLWNTFQFSFALNYIGTKKYIFFKKSFEYKDLVPDVSCIDFLKALGSRYNLAIYLNQRTGKMRIQKRKTIWSTLSYQDITGMSSPIKSIKPQQLKGVLLKVIREENDVFAVVDQKLIGTEGEVVIESPISGVASDRIGFPYSSTEELSGPVFGQKGGSKYTLRIFYAAGMVDGGASEYYGGSNTNGEFTETFDGVDGIYVNEYQEYIRALIKMKEVEVETAFPYRLLHHMDYELRRRYDRSDFLIKEVTVNLTNKGLSVSKVILALM
jgi:hypothetical protein